jgi:hypothetical protein
MLIGGIMIFEDELNDAINEVLACEDPFDALASFIQYNRQLKECRFIFFSKEYGTEIPCFLKNQRIENFHIYNLASANKMLVLDSDTCKEMLINGCTTYNIDTCIALDTQTVSYLKDVFTKEPTYINERSKYYIDYLLKNNINYDYSIYMIENANKLNSKDEKIVTYENLMACERFKALNTQKYIDEGIITYKLSNDELKLLADDSFRLMNNESKSPKIESFWNRYYAIKALLIKTVIIEFLYPKKGVKFKINLLFEFINMELGCILEREVAICYLFFSHDKRIEKFFKKIKPNCGDIIKHISGMSWDLFHLRHLEYLMANIKPLNARYGLYSIITFDYGLQEVLETYPIKRCAIYKGIFIPVFETPLQELIVEMENLQDFILDTKSIRLNNYMNSNHKKLINELEIELNKLININI